MAFSKDFRTPAQLTGVARATIQAVYGESLVAGFLPYATTQSLNYEFNPESVGLTKAAAFRSYNSESDVAVIEGSVTRSGKLPAISRRAHIDEYTHLTMVGGDVGAAFEQHTREIAAQIAVRFIQAAADAIETGKAVIDERGLRFDIDFGRKAALTATASTLWSEAGAKIIEDLEALRVAYGSTPGTVYVPERVMAAIARNAEFIKLAMRRGSDLPTRISRTDVISVFADFGFGNVVTSGERFVDAKGTERDLFKDDKVLFLPAVGGSALTAATGVGALGSTDFGVTAESLATENGLGGTPGAVAGALAHDDPHGYNVLVSAIGLPVLRNANAAASLKVL